VIFNALIIVALIPLALRGVNYQPKSVADAFAAQPAGLRRGRAHRPLHWNHVHRHLFNRPGLVLSGVFMLPNELKIAIRSTLLTAVVLGIFYPLAIAAIGHFTFPHQADGELIVSNGQVTGFSADRPELYRRPAFSRTPIGRGQRL
jgi:hypothetical protein